MIRLPLWIIVVLALALLVGLTAPTAAAEETKGKIKTIFADQDEFLLVDQEGNDQKFQLGENTTILINGEEKTLEDLREGDEVTVTWTNIDGTMVVSCLECRRD